MAGAVAAAWPMKLLKILERAEFCEINFLLYIAYNITSLSDFHCTCHHLDPFIWQLDKDILTPEVSLMPERVELNQFHPSSFSSRWSPGTFCFLASPPVCRLWCWGWTHGKNTTLRYKNNLWVSLQIDFESLSSSRDRQQMMPCGRAVVLAVRASRWFFVGRALCNADFIIVGALHSSNFSIMTPL